MGARHGQGKEICADGSAYEGGFESDMRNGNGYFKDAEGNVYRGDFVNGSFEGKVIR